MKRVFVTAVTITLGLVANFLVPWGECRAQQVRNQSTRPSEAEEAPDERRPNDSPDDDLDQPEWRRTSPDEQSAPRSRFNRPRNTAGVRTAPPSPQIDSMTGPKAAPRRVRWGGQQLCPVTGERLGSMGEPIRIVGMGRTIFVCCEDCVDAVQRNPRKYFAMVAAQRRRMSGGIPRQPSQSDPLQAVERDSRRQLRCPVTGEELGSMGPPVPVTVSGRTIRVCCKACVNTVKRNPAQYLAKVDQEFAAASPLRPSPSRVAQAKQGGGQQFCPVTGKKLGSMGTPVPVTIRDRTIYVCCNGCVEEVMSDPDNSLRKVDAETSGGPRAGVPRGEEGE